MLLVLNPGFLTLLIVADEVLDGLSLSYRTPLAPAGDVARET